MQTNHVKNLAIVRKTERAVVINLLANRRLKKARILIHRTCIFFSVFLLVTACSTTEEIEQASAPSPGVVSDSSNPTPGFVLFAPQNSDTVFLIDKKGKVFHYWQGNNVGLNAYLLTNGCLLHTENIRNSAGSGDPGGRIIMSDWNNKQIWSCTLNSDTLQQSHDVYPMPNGNVLVNVWEFISTPELIKLGRTVCLPDSGLWSGMLIELHPCGDTAYAVWQWRFKDHLISDSTQVAANPQRLNINYMGTPNGNTTDWIHMNATAYNPALDQIVISSRNLNEIYIIDHSTTTAEAAGKSGGKCNHGGDFLYRWGNPAAYNMGKVSDQQLFGQHSPYWLDTNSKSANRILINNDGYTGVYSLKNCFTNSTPTITTFNLIETPYNSEKRDYGLSPDKACGPAAPVWTGAAPARNLWNEFEGNVQFLHNNCFLVCASQNGIFYEMNTEMAPAKITWQFNLNGVKSKAFRCYHYNTDYVEQAIINSKGYQPKKCE